MEIDLATKQQLAGLIAKPATVRQAHAGMLAQLVKDYPYYRPLHLLLSKAGADSSNNEHFATAALYNGGNLLHKVIAAPERLNATNGYLKADSSVEDHALVNIGSMEETAHDEQETFEEIAEINEFKAKENLIDEQETFEEIAEFVPLPKEAPLPVEEEIFQEIEEIDTAAYLKPPTDERVVEPTVQETPNEAILADELALENIVSTDFFAFEKSFTTEQQDPKSLTVVQPEEYDQEAEAQTVSKYDDDKLPYTFLWWLAKTRKEHEQIFQPYVTPKKQPNDSPGELQQQYVEHIFHLQTPFNVPKEIKKGPINSVVAHKGDEIIESFIKNEPQIRAPKAEQLNNENKAKKSAEDHNDLVSETLASIYIEQMLYHKAIETYEKLSLKFPEKSRYFADLIQSLEKKI
jgi:hypothetical protein